MNKIAFLGAGSSVFAKNVLGDCLQTDCLREYEYALFDIDPKRLEESYMMLSNINRNSNAGRAKIVKYSDRKEALRGAKYVVNAIQVGGYEPCTVTDFEIPKKYIARKHYPWFTRPLESDLDDGFDLGFGLDSIGFPWRFAG